MFVHEYQERIRYADTDQMGVVYYGNYPRFYEIGRVEALRDLGFSYAQMERDIKVFLPVINLEIEYLRPAKYDEVITIKTIVKEIPSKKIIFHNEIYNEKGKLLNIAATTLVFYDAVNKKKVDCPEEIASKLKPYFE